jgi:hypothetical protein
MDPVVGKRGLKRDQVSTEDPRIRDPTAGHIMRHSKPGASGSHL